MGITDADLYNANSNGLAGINDIPDATRIVLAILFFCIAVVGLAANSAIIHTFRKSSTLQTPSNVLIVGCVMCDITMILIGYPFVIASNFHGNWLFGAAWCQGYGFVVTLLGVSSICILTAVAIDRYFVITESPFAKKITTFKAAMTILSCLGYGLLWATFPLVGWGRFVVEPGGMSCGPDWANHASSPQSYAIAILVLVLLLPVTIIVFCYLRIFVTVQKKSGQGDEFAARTRSTEVNVAFSSFLIITSFLVAWAPYGVMSVWVMLNDVNQLPQSVAMFAPLLAKSASTWNPLVYVGRSKQFRQAFVKIIFRRICTNRVNVTSVSVEPTQGPSSSSGV
ncbi:visual pigment-like receptor peropsin [Mercenaria mercenaria]|uniref:visual pigment-like receptor peropsin n=1 Tax=Mercenaria mercenaria TaxID=6596 RepID=UPI00234E9380|nr:visual pigment-like receptor peropsin [Mercenaria mercenaria]